MYTQEQQAKLIELAKKSINTQYSNEKLDLQEYSEFSKKQGVFVTLKLDGKLRGCIGYSLGHYPLNEGIKNAAHAAAFEDSRFNPLTESEFKKLKIEISVLTDPKLIIVKDPNEYLEKIEIGKDGLVIGVGPSTGLLLPQVAPEQKWDVKEFLENLCYKAGVSKYEWKEPGVKIYKFQAIIFGEE